MTTTREFIIEKIETFLRETGMSEHRLGMEALRKHRFMKRLRDPSVGVTLTNIEKVEAFMQNHMTNSDTRKG